MEKRFVTLGRHKLVWVQRKELKEHFNIVDIDSLGNPSRRGIEDVWDELGEGVIVELKSDSNFMALPNDARFELFLFKPNNKLGPAMFALEHMDSCIGAGVPDHYEELQYGLSE